MIKENIVISRLRIKYTEYVLAFKLSILHGNYTCTLKHQTKRKIGHNKFLYTHSHALKHQTKETKPQQILIHT